MSTELPIGGWGFVIDTTDYAGNFERQMCAYLTGAVGDCGVGEEYAALYHKELGDTDDTLNSVSDEHGCSRPCSIYPTPGFFNDGMGGTYTEKDDIDQVTNRYRAKMTERFQEQLNILTPDIVGKSGWTKESLDKEIKRLNNNIVCAQKALPGKYPSYQSVIIYTWNKPTNEQIALWKTRAYQFIKLKDTKFSFHRYPKSILGFRIVHCPKTAIEEKNV